MTTQADGERAICSECGTPITYSLMREAVGLTPWRDFRGLGGWRHDFGHKPYHAHRP